MREGRRLILVTCFLLFLSVQFSFSQKTKSELEKAKKENLKKIKEAEKILSETETKRKASIGQLNALNQQIRVREDLINSIRGEITMLEGEVEETNSIVESLEGDLEKLRGEYAKMVYAAYKANRGYSKLTFLFSANSFNQLLMRLKYMKQYSEARQTQVREISKVKEILEQQVVSIELKKHQKDTLLNQQIAESANLDKVKQKQSRVVKSLAKRESELKKELNENKKAIARLDRLIDKLIKNEIARAATASRSKKTNKISLTPEGTKLSTSFEGTKSKLSWPVSSGFITQKFGRQKHPTLRGIIINNNGVNIQTNKNEQVKCVFDGEVVRVAFVQGMGNVVVVKHGDYFTLYSKLKSVNVKNRQKVTSQDIIGTVLTDNNGISELHFEIWKNLKIQNPELWLSRK